jgi:uncharacterized protein YyaL (SSP411 family)
VKDHAECLALETSPYLLQHKNNHRRWYAWGEEALARAKREDKPIFLSIGYAPATGASDGARELSSRKAVAAILNPIFVCIKVDREERPDSTTSTWRRPWRSRAVVAGHDVFLDPEQRPFFAGTYFPPSIASASPAFRRCSDASPSSGSGIAAASTQASRSSPPTCAASSRATRRRGRRRRAGRRVRDLTRTFDATFGGFGSAPKFPPRRRSSCCSATTRHGRTPSARDGEKHARLP